MLRLIGQNTKIKVIFYEFNSDTYKFDIIRFIVHHKHLMSFTCM